MLNLWNLVNQAFCLIIVFFLQIVSSVTSLDSGGPLIFLAVARSYVSGACHFIFEMFVNFLYFCRCFRCPSEVTSLAAVARLYFSAVARFFFSGARQRLPAQCTLHSGCPL